MTVAATVGAIGGGMLITLVVFAMHARAKKNRQQQTQGRDGRHSSSGDFELGRMNGSNGWAGDGDGENDDNWDMDEEGGTSAAEQRQRETSAELIAAIPQLPFRSTVRFRGAEGAAAATRRGARARQRRQLRRKLQEAAAAGHADDIHDSNDHRTEDNREDSEDSSLPTIGDEGIVHATIVDGEEIQTKAAPLVTSESIFRRQPQQQKRLRMFTAAGRDSNEAEVIPDLNSGLDRVCSICLVDMEDWDAAKELACAHFYHAAW